MIKEITNENYFPFGMLMPNRQYSATSIDGYRFGFNGKEKDNGIKGTGNSYDFGARIYDSRLGSWLSLDPLASKFPHQSPYCSFNNNPNLFADPTGESGIVTIDKNTKTVTVSSNLCLYGSAANLDLAKSTAKDIQDSWNAANGKIKIDGVKYKVKFEVHAYFIPEVNIPYGKSLAENIIAGNTSVENNYIRVENNTDIPDGSYTDMLGANTGFYKLSEIAGQGTTTESHEFGHGWGLSHDIFIPDANYPIEQQDVNPGMMAARGQGGGDPNYNYNKDPNGTVDPSKRKVRQENIDALGLDKLKFDKNGKANLGKLSNKYHPK